MTGQLITIYRIEVEGRAYQWQKVDDISIDRIIINKKKVDIDFRYNNGKGDSKMNMKEVEPANVAPVQTDLMHSIKSALK